MEITFNNDQYSPSNHRITQHFTPEDFQEEEALIAKTAELFVRQDVTPNFPKIEQHEYSVSRELFKKAGDLGLLAIEVPEAYGGLELNKKISGLVAEKLGSGGSFSVSYNIHAGVGTLPYVYFGNEKQKGKYLPKLASGEWIGAYALTESDAGSDALRPKTNAVLNEEGTAWVLNGQKQWITNAHLADVFVVFAKTSEKMTAFIVERGYKGVSVGPEEEKMGIKGSSTATLILEDVSVPVENVLGEVGKGHKVAMNILNMARLKLAFSNIGTSKQALQLAMNYGKERKQFDKQLVDFTLIQEKLANMVIAIYGAESAAYRTAGELDDVIDSVDQDDVIQTISGFAIECALNKVNCSEIQGQIIDEAVQIHGGYGYMQDYEVERLYRDARISRIFEGTNEINRLTIAKALLKGEAFASLSAHSPGAHLQEDRNHQFMQRSKGLLKLILKAISNSENLDVELEQEYLRLLADTAKEIYVMESALLRTDKIREGQSAENERMKLLMADVLCEEGYRRMEDYAIEVLSAVEPDEPKRATYLGEIRNLAIPIYQNLFVKKREIARMMIMSPKVLH